MVVSLKHPAISVMYFRTIEELTKALSKDLDGHPAILHPLSVGMARTNDLHHNLSRDRAGGHLKQVKKHTEALALIRKLTELDC